MMMPVSGDKGMGQTHQARSLARGSPRPTGLGIMLQSLNLSGPRFLCHVKPIRPYTSDEAGKAFTEDHVPGTLNNDPQP